MSAATALQNGGTTPVGPHATQAKRCGVCQRTYEPEAWKTLAAVTTLPAAAIKPHLSVPTEWAIEIRTCTCGAVLASLRR
jgi:hypothetical protein